MSSLLFAQAYTEAAICTQFEMHKKYTHITTKNPPHDAAASGATTKEGRRDRGERNHKQCTHSSQLVPLSGWKIGTQTCG
jgi:hypothetical protein